MQNDVKLPRRRSIRLEGWDYSQVGGYFVTIITNRRMELFGQIITEEVNLNIGGKIIEAAWRVLSTRFRVVELGEYVIMPNHLHGIIFIRENVAAPLVGASRGEAGEQAAIRAAPTGTTSIKPTLGQIIGAFKSISTHEYIMAVRRGDVPSFRERLWQRNYYEHIIRDEEELSLIPSYVEGNPACWADDEENPLRLRMQLKSPKLVNQMDG